MPARLLLTHLLARSVALLADEPRADLALVLFDESTPTAP